MTHKKDNNYIYITAITKPQIRALIKRNVCQLGLFDEKLCEVLDNGVRYILRRNPLRAEEMARTRASKLAALKSLATKQNEYLAAHPRADVHKHWLLVAEKHGRLGLSEWVTVRVEDGRIVLDVDQERLQHISELDGCHALKTDLPKETVDAQAIHDRYKDLAQVESAFRTMKTGHLEIRPLFVRSEESTRGHVLVVMLAYLIVRELARRWVTLDITVEQGLALLSTLSAMTLTVPNMGVELHKIPRPRPDTTRLLDLVKPDRWLDAPNSA